MVDLKKEEIVVEIYKPNGKITKKLVRAFSNFSKSLNGFNFTTKFGEYPQHHKIKTVKFSVLTISSRRLFFILINVLAHLQDILTPIKNGKWYSYMVGDLDVSLRKDGENLNVDV